MTNLTDEVTKDSLPAFTDAWNRHDIDALMSFMTDDYKSLRLQMVPVMRGMRQYVRRSQGCGQPSLMPTGVLIAALCLEIGVSLSGYSREHNQTAPESRRKGVTFSHSGTARLRSRLPISSRGTAIVERKAEIARETRETQITLKLNVDGSGKSNISTGVGFLDHMLELFAKHGFFDLEVNATGDLHVDDHHTVEDVGICLGEAFKKAVGDKTRMRRFGNFTVPMYEALARVDLDLCGRPYFHYQTSLSYGKVGTFDVELTEEFFHGFVNHSGTTLHINVPYGTNHHHIIEAIFKAVAKALDISTSIDDRVSGVLSTKGTL